MLFIRKKRPKLNTQADSIRAKLFVQYVLIMLYVIMYFFFTLLFLYIYIVF